MNKEKLVEALIDASYDSGYYSGQKQDGTPHHLAAIERRRELRKQVLNALDTSTSLSFKGKEGDVTITPQDIVERIGLENMPKLVNSIASLLRAIRSDNIDEIEIQRVFISDLLSGIPSTYWAALYGKYG